MVLQSYHIQLMLKQLNNDEFVHAFLGATKQSIFVDL